MAIFNFFFVLKVQKFNGLSQQIMAQFPRRWKGVKLECVSTQQNCRFIIHQYSTRLEECIRLSGLQMTLQKLQTSFFVVQKNEPHEFGIRIKLLCWLSFPILPCFRGDLRTLFPTTTIISPHKKKEVEKTRLYESNFFHALFACH